MLGLSIREWAGRTKGHITQQAISYAISGRNALSEKHLDVLSSALPLPRDVRRDSEKLERLAEIGATVAQAELLLTAIREGWWHMKMQEASAGGPHVARGADAAPGSPERTWRDIGARDYTAYSFDRMARLVAEFASIVSILEIELGRAIERPVDSDEVSKNLDALVDEDRKTFGDLIGGAPRLAALFRTADDIPRLMVWTRKAAKRTESLTDEQWVTFVSRPLPAVLADPMRRFLGDDSDTLDVVILSALFDRTSTSLEPLLAWEKTLPKGATAASQVEPLMVPIGWGFIDDSERKALEAAFDEAVSKSDQA